MQPQRTPTSGAAIARTGSLPGALAAWLAASAACLAQTPPTADPRVVIDRLDANFRQFNAIGVVYPIAKTDGVVITSKYRGTGALISPCHMLTNYHVAFEASRIQVPMKVGALLHEGLLSTLHTRAGDPLGKASFKSMPLREGLADEIENTKGDGAAEIFGGIESA